ncbi:MAG: 2-C-methyl-D-erythritol 2,4-cyclodiphosphate synthase, partial [Flavobacteriales bacterium]
MSAFDFRIGQGLDVHAFGVGDFVSLGGVRIPHTHGLIAHSDGDVLLHALSDALLGALALGDIGRHFPDTDASYKGADSRLLLRHVYQLVQAQGYALVNADITVACERPKLAPHNLAIRQTIAADLACSIDQVSVKATTTEKLGFTGRQEGILVSAVVLLGRTPQLGRSTTRP